MGLREKVTITLVIIALIQIACRHCMPRTPRKASLKRYLNDLKPVKNNPIPTPKSPSRLNKTPKQTFGKTSQNGRISQNSIPKKSLYETYKFPEIDYPLDNFPRDPFHVGMKFYDNNHVSTLQKAQNLQSTAITDLKKEMKMKRKLLSNKEMNNENNPLKTEMSSIKFSLFPDSKHLLNSESFPEVQYPLNAMDTWGPNYWSYLPFTQENQLNKFGHQLLNRQAKEDINKPFTRLTKAKASKYLQSYDKLKEEQRRTSTENSKRSNAGQKGLNYTKTSTCENISDDFMTAGLESNIPINSTETKRTLEPCIEIKASSENTCPVTEYPNHCVPIPYRVNENNTENMSALEQKNNTELPDMDTSVIAQTLQLIEEILFCDDTSSEISMGNYSEDIEHNVDSSNCTDLKTSDENEYIPTTLMQKNCTDSIAEELSIEALNDAPADIIQAKIPSAPEVISAENNSTFEGPLNVRMPLPFSEPEFEAVTNASERGLTNMVPIKNSNTVPGSTSIIIIPINKDSDGKSLSHILETSTGTPIIVYLPSTQNSYIPSQTQNQIVSSSVNNSVPNNELYNLISDMAPLQNDNPPSTALVSDLLNSISDSGFSLPMYETLPTNSMCYNNESSPSSMKEKPVSDILSLIDDAPLRKTICDEKLPEQPTETDNLRNPETLPPTPEFEHPLFDFGGNELSSLSHGPYNNVLKNELPILEREINSFPTQNVTSQYLQKNISNDYFPEITNNASIVALDQNFTFETPTESVLEPIIIEEKPPTPLTDSTAEQPLPISTSRSFTPLTETLSNNLSGIMDIKLSATPNATTDSAPKLLDNTFSPTAIENNSPMTTDMSIKTELYKIRQILDKMLSSGTPTDSQITPMDAILSPISDTERLTMLVNESLEPNQTLIDSDSVSLPFVDNTLTPILASDNSIDSSHLQKHETLLHDLVDGNSSDTLLLPGETYRIPSFFFDKSDTPLPLIVETVPPTPVFEHSAENKPYFIDNLLTPLSDELPTKMGLVIPNIYERPSDGLPLPVEDLPIMVHEEPITNPKSKESTNHLPTQVIEPQNSHSNVQVSNMLHISRNLSIPEVLEATLPYISSESQTTTMGCYKNKIQQDFSPSIILDSSEVERKHKILPLSFIPDVSPDTFANEPFLPDDSPSPINAKIGDFPHTNTDTKDLISVEDHLLLPEDDAHPDTVVANSHSAVSLSTKLDKTNDDELFKYTHSDLPRDDLILTDDKILTLTDNTSTDLPLAINKTPTTSKLSIAMALLENVLSDITKEGLSSSVTKPLSITPSPILDKTKYQVDFESQLLEAIEIPPAEKVFHKSDASTNLKNPENPQDILPLQEDKAPSVTPNLDIPTKDLPFKMDEVCTGLSPDIQTDDIDKCLSPQERAETLPLDNPDDVLLPIDKVPLPLNTLNRNSLLNKNTISASKRPIPTTLLENVLSDVSTKGFSSTAASKAFPVKTPSVLDKTTFYLESPLSDLTEEISSPSEIPPVNKNISSTTHSEQPAENNLHFSGQSADTLPWEVNKTLAEVSSLHIPSEMLNNKALLKSDVDMISPKAEILLQETPSDLPSSNNKTLSSSKLPIAKTILQNVLSDVTSESFSLPVSKVLPVKSSSLTDKSSYYLESPLSDRTEVSNLSSVNEMISSTTLPGQASYNNLLLAGKPKENVPLEKDKTLSAISSFDIPSEISSLNIPSEITSIMEKSIADISSPKAEILPTNTHSDLPLSNSKTLSSSKLPITKALLENVLSDVTSESFSLPVSKVLPVKSSSLTDKAFYYLESPLSDRTEVSNLSSVNEMINSTILPDQPSDNNLPFDGKFKENVPLEKDKTLSAISRFDIPSEISSLDIPLEITSPMEKSVVDISSPKAEFFPIDTQSDLPSSNTKTRSSSKLPIAKAILQNVLSDVTSESFSLPVSKVLPVKSSSLTDKTSYYLESPLSDRTEVTNLSSVNEMILSTTFPDQPCDKNLSFAGKPKENVPLEKDKTLSAITRFDIPSEISSLDIPLEITSPMEKSVVDISSPKAEFFPIDTQSDLPSSNTKTRSSSKLPIAKAILQNVLSDVTSESFSLPVSKVLPVKSSSLTDKTSYYLESPLSDRTEVTNLSSVNEMILSTTFPDQPCDKNLSFAGKSKENVTLEIDKTHSAITSFDIPSEISSLDIPLEITSPMEKSVVDISSPKAEFFPTDTQSDLPSSNTKTLSSSKLPITKALLENVLSDVTSESFSLPVSKVLPVKSSSLTDKTFYYLESPLSDRSEVSNLSSVNEMINSTILFDQRSDNNLPFAGKFEENVPLERHKTLSAISSFDIPSEISSLDIPSEITSPMEKSVVDISSPKAEIFPIDTQSDLPSSNTKTRSSSKLPIAKAILQNVLSDVTSESFSLPVSKVLPVKSSSLTDKTSFYLESLLSDRTEVTNLSSVNEMILSTILPDQPSDNNLPFDGKFKENVPLEKNKTLSAISRFDIPSEISSLDIPLEITSPMEKSVVDISSPKAEIFPIDTQSDLPSSNTKTRSSSKLPIAKAILQNVLSDVTSESFSLPVSKVLPVKSSSLTDKTSYYLESPLSDRSEVSNLSSVNEMILSTTLPDQPCDKKLSFAGKSKENVTLEIDKTHSAITSFDIPSEITSPMEKSVVDISSPKAEFFPTDTQSDLPSSNTKTLSSSKLPITKALLENVLSDVTSESFSLPVSKVLPVKSSSLTDKTFYYLESPLSDRSEVSNLSSVNEMINSTILFDQRSDNNLPFAGKFEENVPLERHKTLSAISSFDIPSEISSLDIPSEITSPMEKSVVDISSPKAEIFPIDTQSDLPSSNTKTRSSSKLPIAKAILQNVLSDVTSESFSLPVSKVLPVKSSSLTDKTSYYLESLLSDRTEVTNLSSVNEMILSTILPDQPSDNNLPFDGKFKENVPLEKNKTLSAISRFDIPSEISSLDIPLEITSPMEKSVVDISSPKAEIFPIDTQSDLPSSNTKTRSSSKLPIAKAILQNVLSDVTSESFSLPVSKVLPVKSSSLTDKTSYYLESPLSDRSEVSNLSSVNEMILSTTLPDQPCDKKLSFAGKSKENVTLEIDKTHSAITSFDIPSEISSLDIPLEITSPMEKSVVDISSPKAEFFPTDTQSDLPSSNTKTLSSSKLPITKALLENVLSDVTSESFSLPVSKVLPVKSSSLTDKTFYYLESPLSDRTEVSNLSSVNEMINSTILPDQPSDNNLPFDGKFKENVPLEKDKTLSAISRFDIPSEISSLDIPLEITSPMEKSVVDISSPKAEIFPIDTQSDLPSSNTKTRSSSKLPIAKAILQNVLSDVTSESFSLPVSKVLPVKSSSLTDKTSYYLESPLSDRTEVTNLSSVNEMILSTILPDQHSDNNLPFDGKFKENVPLEKNKTLSAISRFDIPSEISSLDIPLEITSPMEKSVVDISSPKAEIFPIDTQSDLPSSNTKTRSSSKLPIAKAILQNVLSDVTSESFSLPVSKVLPVKSSSLTDKTSYYLESPLSDRTKVTNLSSVNEMILSTILPDQPSDNNLPFDGKFKENVPLEKNKTLSAISRFDIPSEISSLDIPLEITSPMEKSVVDISSPKAEIFPIDTQSDLPSSNTKTRSSSKLPIAKAILQNVLSDVTSESFSLPVSKVLPVKSSSLTDKTSYYLESPLSDRSEASNLSSSTTLPDQPCDKNLSFAGKSKENVTLEIDKTHSAITSFDIPSEISSLDIPLEITSPMEKSVVDISSPKAEIFPTDTHSDLPLSNSKTLSSSKLPITKALLENVLSDVTSESFSLPVSKVLPVKSSSLTDKTFYYLESPLSDRSEVSNLSSVNEMINSTILPDQPSDNNLPFAGKFKENVPLEKDKTLSTISSFDIPSEISTLDIPLEITSPMEKSVVDISSPKTEILPTDTPSELPLSSYTKTIPSSKLPIVKKLLQNVLSDVTSESFSLPVSKVLPVKSSSLTDKTFYYLESPLSDRTEVSNLSSVNEMINSTILPDQPSDNNLPFAGKFEENVPLERDKTLSAISSFDIPSEVSRLDIPLEITSPMEKSVVDISSPKTEILPTDTPSELPLSSYTKTIPSSKLPIVKKLLQNVLSDVTSESFSLPVSKVLPVKSSSLTDKTSYYLESPLSDCTEVSNLTSVNEIISSTTLPDQPCDNNLSFAGKSKENVPLDIDKTHSAISSFDIPSEISSLDIPSEITSPIEKSVVDISSTKAEILPTDTPSELPLSSYTKTIPSSKLPIVKKLLQNVLSDVTSESFSLPVSKVLPVKSSSLTDKTSYYLESPLSDRSEASNLSSSTTLPDQPCDKNLSFAGKSKENVPLDIDKTHSAISSFDIPSEISRIDILSEITSPMEKSVVDISSPTAEILPTDTQSDLPSSNSKTHSSSKIPITKALLQNILSDVTSKSFSLPVSKVLPVKSSSLTDKTSYYLESPLSDRTEVSNLSSVNEMISSTKLRDQPSDNNLPFAVKSKENVPSEIDKTLSAISSFDIPSEISSLDIPSEITSPMEKSVVDISSPKAKILPTDTQSDLPLSNSKTLSSSKLPITKALLENVLSDVTTKDFALPVIKVLQVKSSPVLDKSLYKESPYCDLTEESPLPSINKIISSTTLPDQPTEPFSEKHEALPPQVDKTLSEVSSLDIPPKMSSSLTDQLLPKSNVDITSQKAAILSKDTPSELPLSSYTKTIPSSKLPIVKKLLQNVLSDVTSKGFSLPVFKALPVKSSSVLDETLYYEESPLPDPTERSPLSSVNDIISSKTPTHQSADNNYISEQSEETLPLEVDQMLSEVSSLDIPSEILSLIPNVDITLPKAEIIPEATPSDLPLLNTKALPSSKLSITKALLENVLSEINTKEFSLPVAQSRPVESRSQLDKTLYYMESPLSDRIKESSQDNFSSSEINDDVLKLSLEKIFSDHPNLNMPTDDLPIDQISKDESDNLTEEIEDEESVNMSNDLRMSQNK